MTDSSQVCYKISDQRFVLPDQCIFASSTPELVTKRGFRMFNFYSAQLHAYEKGEGTNCPIEIHNKVS